ncbi:FAD/NAD(P)-binding domain-containing protein [Aspergillus niger ATCC 13496]|uniref:FAD/NAD(P)-binding domain-containing protein n=1 Tax=Aspergillus niger ATCC 13496 TaxID=1353008 RepID=A0A370BLM8_ASPNG|nr:FAD/NAD(P)-binding domain-containing protein [Aspergillus niger ATCC 13496]
MLPMSDTPSYSQIACIGTGLSAIALGATLQRWYGFEDIRFFDRHPASGGTWYTNSYPGCACDVPSALYSYSFELNPNWSKSMPSFEEIKEYSTRMIHSVEVTKCIWKEDANRWLLYLRDVNSGERSTHECQILFAATGRLVEPRPCDTVGAETFSGTLFHSSQWRHDVRLRGQNVIIIGNGCTAAQIVPAIIHKVNSLTQIIRSQHWVSPASNYTYGPFIQWVFCHIPFAMRLHRLQLFLLAEKDFRLFPMTKAAARLRKRRSSQVEHYMRATAPDKYHNVLVPDYEIGCKRRIFDCGYLASLNEESFILTDTNIERIIPEGIKTDHGVIPADIIILATGFKTNQFLSYMEVIGRGGKSVTQHWDQYGGPGAYNTSPSALSERANTESPNSSVNYALRILKPILQGRVLAVEIKEEAEQTYIHEVQKALAKRVWNAGCASTGLIRYLVVYQREEVEFHGLSLEPGSLLVAQFVSHVVGLEPQDSEVSQTQWILGADISPPFAWLCSAGCSRISDPKDEEAFRAVINGCFSELCLRKPRSCFKVTVVNVDRLLQGNSGGGIIHLSGA